MRAPSPRTLRGVGLVAILALAAAGCGAATARPTHVEDPVGSPPGERVDTRDWPSARRIASRAMVLCTVAARGFLDAERPADAEEMQQDLEEFLDRNDLRGELEPAE